MKISTIKLLSALSMTAGLVLAAPSKAQTSNLESCNLITQTIPLKLPIPDTNNYYQMGSVEVTYNFRDKEIRFKASSDPRLQAETKVASESVDPLAESPASNDVIMSFPKTGTAPLHFTIALEVFRQAYQQVSKACHPHHSPTRIGEHQWPALARS